MMLSEINQMITDETTIAGTMKKRCQNHWRTNS